MGGQSDAIGLRITSNQIYDRYQKPVFIAENGVELFGYTIWGIIDLVSSGTMEMLKRYGAIYVDADNEGNGTYDRIKKDSFYWYQKCIASNGEDLV